MTEVTHLSMNLYIYRKQALISLVICSVYHNIGLQGLCHGIAQYSEISFI